MSNAPQLTPGQAIERIIMTFDGYFELRKSNPRMKRPSLYLQGEPGIGKTSIARAIAKHFNYLYVEILANQRNPDDIAGIQMPNVETGTTNWFRPSWLPKPGPVIVDGHEYAGTLLFFDELASADDRVRKPLFSTFLEYSLNGEALPENTIVMAAGNTADTGTMVFEFDNATRARFITLDIIADFTSWQADYASTNDISPTIVALLKANLGIFCETKVALEKRRDLYGNPRNWEDCSDLEKAIMRKDEHRRDPARRAALTSMIAGKVGKANAETFDAVFETVAQMTNLIDLLQAKKEGKSLSKLLPTELSQLHALSFSMMAYPTDIDTGREIYDLMKEFPKDSDIPFQDTIPAIQETILKKLRKGGFKDKDLQVFREDTAATVDEYHQGPLIKIEL